MKRTENDACGRNASAVGGKSFCLFAESFKRFGPVLWQKHRPVFADTVLSRKRYRQIHSRFLSPIKAQSEKRSVICSLGASGMQDAGAPSSASDTRGPRQITPRHKGWRGRTEWGSRFAPNRVAASSTVACDTLKPEATGSAPTGRIARVQCLASPVPQGHGRAKPHCALRNKLSPTGRVAGKAKRC